MSHRCDILIFWQFICTVPLKHASICLTEILRKTLFLKRCSVGGHFRRRKFTPISLWEGVTSKVTLTRKPVNIHWWYGRSIEAGWFQWDAVKTRSSGQRNSINVERNAVHISQALATTPLTDSGTLKRRRILDKKGVTAGNTHKSSNAATTIREYSRWDFMTSNEKPLSSTLPSSSAAAATAASG